MMEEVKRHTSKIGLADGRSGTLACEKNDFSHLLLRNEICWCRAVEKKPPPRNPLTVAAAS